jgi:hypothetical protein
MHKEKRQIDDYRLVFKSGMRVRIKKEVPLTTEIFSVISSMLDMLGGEYIIGNVDIDRVWIGGFMWCGEDLIITDEEILKNLSGEPLSVQILTFDPENLSV